MGDSITTDMDAAVAFTGANETAAEDLSQVVMGNDRYIPLMLLSTMSSLLSIFGSSCIIYLSSRPVSRRKIFQRLLFSLSMADLVSSTACLMMPLAVPEYLGYFAAVGNHKTCAAAGFFMLVADKAGCCYNAYISLQFLLVVKWRYKESDFTVTQAIVGHAVALLVPTAIDIAAVATQSINPSRVYNNVCVYDVSPWGCAVDGDEDCTRSNLVAEGWFMRVTFGFYTLIAFVGFAATFMVWLTVRGTVRKSNAYRFENQAKESIVKQQHPVRESQATDSAREGSSSTRPIDPDFTEDPSTRSSTAPRRGSMMRSSSTDAAGNKAKVDFLKEIRDQSILYSLVYLNAFTWPVVSVILASAYSESEHGSMHLDPGIYAFDVLSRILFPLQGFLNFFVYTRMTRRQWRRAKPDKSIFWIYRRVLSMEPVPTPTRSRTRTRSPPAIPRVEKDDDSESVGRGRLDAIIVEDINESTLENTM